MFSLSFLLLLFFSRTQVEISLRTDVFPVVTSLHPKSNVREPERQNNFRDVIPFVLMLASQMKGENTALVTPRDLARWRVLGFGES